MTVDCIIFDLDGTLTRVASPWRWVHERLGLWETSASRHLEEWLSGTVTYEQFCARDFELWKGRSVEDIEAFLDEIEINPHLPGIVERLRGGPVQSIIISSGFSTLARRIQSSLDWEPLRIYANELVAGPRVRIQVSADACSPLSKKRVASTALEDLGVEGCRTLAVSDSERDLEMMDGCRHRLLLEQDDDLAQVHGFLR